MVNSEKDLQLIELKDTISQLNNTIKTLNQTIANQQAEIEWFKHKLFGSSSEKRAIPFPGQYSFLEDVPEEDSAVEIIEPEIVPTKNKSKKKKPTLEKQFKNIPTRQVLVDTLTEEEKSCPICGTEMSPIGTEVIRTEVIFHPAKLERIEYIATTYECLKCKDTEDPQFIKDNGKEAFLPHSYMSESLLSYIAYRKYGLYTPLYRQEKDFIELGTPISRTTMASALVNASKKYLKPMYDYFHRKLLERRFIMMDETPVQVLKEQGRSPQSKSYFWVIRTGEDEEPPIILLNYTKTRAGENAKRFLEGMDAGSYIMTDAYQGYNVLEGFKRCICYAHIRRYFLEAIPKGKEKDLTLPSVQGVLYCDKLFSYERTYKEKGLSYKQIKNRREKDARPVIEAFIKWCKRVDPGSNERLKKALNYVKNREQYLMTYLEDGRCSLSNNLSENAIRPVTVGRKNWLFSDTPDGAKANAVYLTMAAMTKAHNISFQNYLNFIFENRPSDAMSDEEFEMLAPWNKYVQEICGINNNA